MDSGVLQQIGMFEEWLLAKRCFFSGHEQKSILKHVLEPILTRDLFLVLFQRAVLRGVVKRAGILCACSSCKGRKVSFLSSSPKSPPFYPNFWGFSQCAFESQVVSPYYFEVHAGSTKKHPSDYIFLENGNNLHDVLRACANATLDMLESAIRKAIGPAPQKRTFRCQTCKSGWFLLSSLPNSPSSVLLISQILINI